MGCLFSKGQKVDPQDERTNSVTSPNSDPHLSRTDSYHDAITQIAKFDTLAKQLLEAPEDPTTIEEVQRALQGDFKSFLCAVEKAHNEAERSNREEAPGDFIREAYAPPTAPERDGHLVSNLAGNQPFHVEQWKTPASRQELQDAMHMERVKLPVRAVTTAWSFSDILQTTGTMIDSRKLWTEHDSVLLPLETDLVRDGVATQHLQRVVSGAKIQDVVDTLANLVPPMALLNLGGATGQTLVGAMATATHGSGIFEPGEGVNIAPLSDSVVSLDLLTTDAKWYRIEPTNGQTDPALFNVKHGATMTLVQDDARFHSVVVGLGCMGVIYSVTVRVMPRYKLTQIRDIVPWSKVRASLEDLSIFASDRPDLGPLRLVEVLINPYSTTKTNGRDDYKCLVTHRYLAPPETKLSRHRIVNDWLQELSVSGFGQRALNRIMRISYLVPTLVDAALKTLKYDDPFTGWYDQIMNIGPPNNMKVLSAEIGHSMDGVNGQDPAYIGAMDRLIEVINQNKGRGMMQTSPVAMRFVAPSASPLAPQAGRNTCMVETPLLLGDEHKDNEALLSYERAMMEVGGRPHWGQINTTTGDPQWLARAYPGIKQWKAVHAEYNHKGWFNNQFTERLGISQP
eukprot:m.112990 g.112990  ORF g.112990 m.112990 type:complete len:625 (-) comp10791_c0_seq3:376-2250(-)